MLCHSLQSSASRHMDRQPPQLTVHALPHRGLSLPGWWRNSTRPASPKRESRATACSPKAGRRRQVISRGQREPFPASRGRPGRPLTPRPLSTALVLLAHATRQEKETQGTGGERQDTALLIDACCRHRKPNVTD